MRPAILAGLAAIVLLAAAVVPALAKEFLTASLDAPIAMDTPPGTEILVGITVLGAGETGDLPVDGSPIYLKLTGRDGSTTRAAGAADGKPGHYTMRIEIPGGGVRGVEVGIHGTSDLPILLGVDPLTFGPITARTARVAPPLAPALTPFPRASAAVAAPVAPTVVEPVAGPSPVLVVVLGGLLAAVAIGLALAIRQSRRGRRPEGIPAPDRASGA